MAVLSRAFERLQSRSQARAAPSLRLRPLLAIVGAIVTVALLLQIVQTSGATQTSFEIRRLEGERLELQARVHELESEIGHLSSLARIEREARERLGLVPPQSQTTVPVNVAKPAVEQKLPTRFAPAEEPEVEEQGSSWWRDLLRLLPLN